MKGIILYKTKYETSKVYAQRLSEMTGFIVCDLKKVKLNDILNYDIIILGGGVYASGISGLSFLKKNISVLKGKKIAVFCCGASPYDEQFLLKAKDYNTKGKLKNIPLFYCRGKWDMEKMSFLDKTLCKMLKKSVSKKDPSQYEVWEKALIETGENSCDWTDKKYLDPIIMWLKKISKI